MLTDFEEKLIDTVKDNRLGYLEFNTKEIAKNLKHINWNLGKVVGFIEGNPTLINDIQKAMSKSEAEPETKPEKQDKGFGNSLVSSQ